MIELKDTIELMCSDDWKKRLVAEYAQAVIRRTKLEKAINNHGTFEPKDRVVLEQSNYLDDYTMALAERIEDILGAQAVLYDIDDWVYNHKPLTLFDEKVELIQLKGNDNEVLLGVSTEDGCWLSQDSNDTHWGLESPIFSSYEEAVKEWNEMVCKMNGDVE